MTTEKDQHGAGVRWPPPLIFILFLLSAYGMQYLWPLKIGTSVVIIFVGALLVILGLGVIILVGITFKRVKTGIEPWKPTTRIITSGLFSQSRNPIYVALCLISIGIGLLLNSGWLTLSFIPSAMVVYHTAIKKEEAYLENKFGDEYTHYKDRVNRWI